MKDTKRYDLTLGAWGPYNKVYCGAAHVADPARGAAFQIELFPGIFRRKLVIAHCRMDSGLYLWGANADLTRFAYRYELEWKDRLYCDAEFTVSHDRRCDIACTFVNNTELPQTVNLKLCASMQYPILKKNGIGVGYLTHMLPVLPRNCVYIDAPDYDDMTPHDIPTADGKYRGEVESDNATGMGTVITGNLFRNNTHFLRYRPDIDASSIGIRYTAERDTAYTVTINGSQTYTLPLPAATVFSYAFISIEPCHVDMLEFRPTGVPTVLDCLCIGDGADRVTFVPDKRDFIPERTVEQGRMTLRYEGIDTPYTVEWDQPVQLIQRLYCFDVGSLLREKLHDHVSTEIRGEGEGCYDTLLTEPLFLAPGESQVMHFTVTAGAPIDAAVAEPVYAVRTNPAGKPFAFSQNMMAYNTLLNVVYPIYTRRSYIRHNTPGRNWDSLYSWDSGFTGMGLATTDFRRAYDCLYTYLCPVGDSHSPYIFHGSVVPTQIFLYKELLDRYPEKRSELDTLWPMMKQYYNFFAHMGEGACQTGSGLSKAWHIFYNSGGWDDYPPQKALHAATNRRAPSDIATTANTTPVITTAATVLISRMMAVIAAVLGHEKDIPAFTATAERLSALIQAHCWDDEAGYYSYVVHDKDGKPAGFFRAPDGSNYNQGMDGIYPYIAGIGNAHQCTRMLDNLDHGMMTDIGVSVVDTRASYYSNSGYWNGSVWMPHQWILWKALLDRGELDRARKIADRALQLWAREVNDTYCCFEHFMCRNGRGCGYHHFSGLSTPVLLFFAAYYTPGTVTLGLRSVLISKTWNESDGTLSFICRSDGEHPTALVCLPAGTDYHFTVNGRSVDAPSSVDGTYAVPLDKGECTIVAHV